MRIKSLKLRNFKGIQHFEGNFNGGPTSIYGENGIGKTTLVDAYMWLLFDKDSSNRSNFNVKTLDKNNNPIHRLEHEVEGVFLMAGGEITLRKTLVEKWVKKRGSEVEEFSGHETTYYIQDVPKKKSEYNDFISDEMATEAAFRLVSIPGHFASLPWQSQRELLFGMAGELSDNVIAAGNTKYEDLLATIAQSKTNLTEYNKSISNKIRKLKETLENIPSRLDEVDRNKPEAKNWAEIEKEIATLKGELETLNNSASSIASSYKAEEEKIEALRQKLRAEELRHEAAKSTAREIASTKRLAISQDKHDIQEKITELNNTTSEKRKEIARLTAELTTNNTKTTQLRADWHKENEAQPDISVATCCPTCKRDFDQATIVQDRNEAINRFNGAKALRLKEINEQGAALKESTANTEVQISTIEGDLKQMEKDLSELISKRDKLVIPSIDSLVVEEGENVEAAKWREEINTLLTAIKPVEVDTSIKEKREEITTKIAALEKSLSDRDLITKAADRTTELKAQQKTLSQNIADLEREQDTIAQFNRERINQIEAKVSGMFDMVKFRLFTTQINGGEAETCEAMVDGVPWSDLNTASRVNAGIDITNALSAHFNVVAPLWIDGRESVTELIDTKAQTISLIVKEGQKELLIA